jgi:hypothetical protein
MKFIMPGETRALPWRQLWRFGLFAAAVILGPPLVALGNRLGMPWASAHRLATARGRFEAEVGRPPAVDATVDYAGFEQAFEERLGGPARLSDPAGLLPRLRGLLERAPAAWSNGDVEECRRFLAANTALLAAGERAAERHVAALPGAAESSLREPRSLDISRIWNRAASQQSVLRLSIHLDLADRSPANVGRAMAGLAAGVKAFQDTPGMQFQMLALDLEKGFLKELAAVVADPGVDAANLTAIRRLLPHPPVEARVRQLFAGEAGYLLAVNSGASRTKGQYSDADLAQVLDGYRHLALALATRGGTRVAAANRTPAASGPRTLPGAILAELGPIFEAIVDRIEAIDAAQQLAGLALDLRLAAAQACAYPATLEGLPLGSEPDSFTHHRPEYRRDDVQRGQVAPGGQAGQGGALLSNPAAAAASAALPHCPKAQPYPFTWRLPPPCPPAARR